MVMRGSVFSKACEGVGCQATSLPLSCAPRTPLFTPAGCALPPCVQEVECRLHPITHREAAPTLPPALQVGEGPGGRKRRVRPSFTSAHMTQMIMPQHANTIGAFSGGCIM